ncbi:DUF3413 domain-containing protein [Litorilituus sediminis]|uniref:DUF3413 domain-containing protein n=1 Tax=Litorilituus sediminis TaxID=718192 RepID=A0A4P6P5K1_9GAMM|nr:DUF3413 domain-containing protein [Litorilituus sediminis]QBG34615.1 DUF3413 domain-containing protein [Litorilituus sediminis]
MVSFDTKSYSKKLLHLISWGHWFTFFNILAAITLSSYYLFNEAAPETLFGQVYLITTWLSHIGFLTFISFVLILFPLTLLYPNTRFIRASGSIIFTIGLLLLVLDGFVYSRLGYHLNASSSSQIIDLIKEQISINSVSFYSVIAVLALVILSFELVVSNYAWKHLKQLQRTVFARFVVFFLVLSFFFSHLSHIWADANLDYDILRQDTVLPLSYPATAKTLLTKYGLFNKADYIERKTSPLSFTSAIPAYPALDGMSCNSKEPKESIFLVLTDKQLTSTQVNQFQQRASGNSLQLDHHIDTGIADDTWFNMFYSLPSIYQEAILKQGQQPLLFQALAKHDMATSFTSIRATLPRENTQQEPTWYDALFHERKQITDISSILFAEQLNAMPVGLHVFYFDTKANQDNPSYDGRYQFELFVDALLLAQKHKETKDIIWVSSMGNDTDEARLSSKPALLIYPNKKINAEDDFEHVTSHMDLQPTLLSNMFTCMAEPKRYSSGADLLTLNKDRVIANTTAKGMMVFNKDKSVFIDQNGNFQSYSRQLQAPITIKADFPLMIDGVHFIKQFSQYNQAKR